MVAREDRGNIARDQSTDAHLRELGSIALRFWEHEDMAAAAARIAVVVGRLKRKKGGRQCTALKGIPVTTPRAATAGRAAMRI